MLSVTLSASGNGIKVSGKCKVKATLQALTSRDCPMCRAIAAKRPEFRISLLFSIRDNSVRVSLIYLFKVSNTFLLMLINYAYAYVENRVSFGIARR